MSEVYYPPSFYMLPINNPTKQRHSLSSKTRCRELTTKLWMWKAILWYFFDGLDQTIGVENVIHKVLDRPYKITPKHQSIECIIYSHPRTLPSSERARQFSLEPKYVRDEIRLFRDRSVSPTKNFHDNQEAKEAIVQRVIDSAQGSLILEEYTIGLLNRKKLIKISTEPWPMLLTFAWRSSQRLISQLKRAILIFSSYYHCAWARDGRGRAGREIDTRGQRWEKHATEHFGQRKSDVF